MAKLSVIMLVIYGDLPLNPVICFAVVLVHLLFIYYCYI